MRLPEKHQILLAGLLLLGAGVFGFVTYLGFDREFAPIWKARASREWQATQGRILEASAFFWRQKRSPGKGRPESGYLPHLRYRYAVNGKEYVRSRLRFASDDPELFAEERDAAALIAPFHPGDPIQVFHEPSDPGNATLTTSYHLSLKGILYSCLCGILALAFTGGALLQLFGHGSASGRATRA